MGDVKQAASETVTEAQQQAAIIEQQAAIIEANFDTMWKGEKYTPEYNAAAKWFIKGWLMSIYWQSKK